MEIKNLNDGINWRTIPKVIKEEFSKNGHIREQTHFRNSEGKFEVIYGEIIRPQFIHYKNDCVNFYLNEKFVEQFHEPLHLKLLFDEEFNVISIKNILPFYIEYSKGFEKGYSEFEGFLKTDNPIFGATNEHIAYKIYSRVMTEKKGSFPMYLTPTFNQTELEKKIRKEKGIKLLFKLNKKSFFNSGFEGGEFYKAWEIILNNPTIFEPIFIKYSEKKTKTDLSQQLGQTYIPKPCFKLELIDSITKDLNAFFEVSQHAELKRIIETGSNANVKLLFRDNGNKLTDYFRELFNNNTITGCTKTVLINWIIDSFKYTYRGGIKNYDFKTVEKTISNKDRLCKNPII